MTDHHRNLLIERGQKQTAESVLDLIEQYGGIDGEHHKQWLLDQIVRELTGESYSKWLQAYTAGEDGPNTYSEWEPGVPP